MKTMKHARLSQSANRQFAHANTAVIQSRLRVLQVEAEEIDKSILAMQSALAMLKARRLNVEAFIAGLDAVTELRALLTAPPEQNA